MHQLNRRSALTAIGLTSSLIVTGCIGDDSSHGDGTDDKFQRTVRLIDFDEVPAEIPLDISMEVTEEQITADTTGHLRKEIENTHEDPLSFERIFYKGSSRVASDAGILVFSLDAADTPSIDEAVHCVPEGDPDAGRNSSAMTEEGTPWHHNVEPGQPVEIEYIISDDWEVDGCFPLGEYRFDGQTVVALDEAENDTKNLQWGFTIEISE